MQMAYSLPRGSTTLPPIDALATVDGPGRSAAGFLGFKVYLTHQEVRQIAAGAAAAAVIPEPDDLQDRGDRRCRSRGRR